MQLKDWALQRSLSVLFSLVVALVFCWPGSVEAANTTWSTDTSLYLSGSDITLTIVSGSQSDSLSVTTTTFTVSVAAGEIFTIKYPGPDPGNLANDGGLTACQYSLGNNVIAVNGGEAGATVTFTPATTPICRATGGGGGGGGAVIAPAYAQLSAPSGGQNFNAGEIYTVSWLTGGYEVSSVRLSLTTNGGTSWSVIAANRPISGTYSWTIPSVSTTQGKIRVEAMSSSGLVKASDISVSNFSITATVDEPAESDDEPADDEPAVEPPPTVDPSLTGGYSPSVATASTPDIDTDMGLLPPPADQPVYCKAQTLIKALGFPAVYYCGLDGRRYIFVNERVFYSWFTDFSTLVEMSLEDIARIPIGGNITYRPGTRMVKIESDPRVYAIARGGLLRWVQTEAVAAALYGPDWNRMVDDVPVAFWVNYRFGDPITPADVGLE